MFVFTHLRLRFVWRWS